VTHSRQAKKSCRQRPYRVECTGSLPNSEVKRRRARLVLGWGTAREDLRVLLAFCVVQPAHLKPGLALNSFPLKTALPAPVALPVTFFFVENSIDSYGKWHVLHGTDPLYSLKPLHTCLARKLQNPNVTRNGTWISKIAQLCGDFLRHPLQRGGGGRRSER
jgi:hypothetical protein